MEPMQRAACRVNSTPKRKLKPGAKKLTYTKPAPSDMVRHVTLVSIAKQRRIEYARDVEAAIATENDTSPFKGFSTTEVPEMKMKCLYDKQCIKNHLNMLCSTQKRDVQSALCRIGGIVKIPRPGLAAYLCHMKSMQIKSFEKTGRKCAPQKSKIRPKSLALVLGPKIRKPKKSKQNVNQNVYEPLTVVTKKKTQSEFRMKNIKPINAKKKAITRKPATKPLPAATDKSNPATKPLPAATDKSNPATKPLPAATDKSNPATKPLPAATDKSNPATDKSKPATKPLPAATITDKSVKDHEILTRSDQGQSTATSTSTLPRHRNENNVIPEVIDLTSDRERRTVTLVGKEGIFKITYEYDDECAETENQIVEITKCPLLDFETSREVCEDGLIPRA